MHHESPRQFTSTPVFSSSNSRRSRVNIYFSRPPSGRPHHPVFSPSHKHATTNPTAATPAAHQQSDMN
ncbi:hypothetical protein E4U53_000824, partial [Claviceps sorghi]